MECKEDVGMIDRPGKLKGMKRAVEKKENVEKEWERRGESENGEEKRGRGKRRVEKTEETDECGGVSKRESK